jgi:hypothetical protein
MRLALLLIITVTLNACANAQTLPANYFYRGSYIDIHSPNQAGWKELIKTQSEIVFGKKGKNDNASYVARVVFFSLEETKSDKEFLRIIREIASTISNKKRFSIVEDSFKLSSLRSYPCVLSRSLLKDKNAKTAHENNAVLFMQVKALFCKDPKREGAGFMIGYSYRGEAINRQFDTEADSFIKGVEFPEEK